MKRQITLHSVGGVRGRPGVPRNHGIGKTAYRRRTQTDFDLCEE
jgi:hypothetical protein